VNSVLESEETRVGASLMALVDNVMLVEASCSLKLYSIGRMLGAWRWRLREVRHEELWKWR